MNQAEAFIQRSHEHNDKDDFRTPMYIINWLKSKFGDLLRDGACSEENKKGEPINVFDFNLISKNEWIYVNPPFDTPSIIKFVEACSLIESNDRVFLLPNKLCQKSFCLNVNKHFDEIHMLGGRIDFLSPYAVKGGASMNGCFIGVMKSNEDKKNERPVVYCHTLSDLKKRFSDV
tara:strand:+ start:375 stop:899 length:525 start_codon:yes stop_codon:yes gene_type:complete